MNFWDKQATGKAQRTVDFAVGMIRVTTLLGRSR